VFVTCEWFVINLEVKLKWGIEYEGHLVSVDSYMKL
jgi:small nuclear ribonucleoprotein (snRNP)-like protein